MTNFSHKMICIIAFLFSVAVSAGDSDLTYLQFDDTKHLPWSEPVFGPEFTFIRYRSSDQKLVDASITDLQSYVDWLKTHLIENQPDGEKFWRARPNQDFHILRDDFISPDGWSFIAKPDQGVIEVTMSPMTYTDYARHAANIQDAIFASAAHENLYPALFTGGGHISIDRTLFDNNALLFRNFFVDFCNHAELAMGILNYDTNNALPFFLLNPGKIEKIKKAIERFDTNYNPSPYEQKKQVDALYEDINLILKAASEYDSFNWSPNGHSRTSKYHAVGLLHFDEGRFEVRSIRPQASFDVFLRQIRLLRNRLKYVRELRYPIPLKPYVNIQLDRSGVDDRFVPPVAPQEALRAFYVYVTESGEKWQDHRDYLWPAWVHPIEPVESELSKFERSQWFKSREIKRTMFVELSNGCTVERIQTPYKMRNQGATSTCWLHSALQMMEQLAGQPLSIDALLIPEIKSRALDRYLGFETPWDGGAGPTRPFALALEHGLVPESVWNKNSVIVENYHAIFSEIEELLTREISDKTVFLAHVEDVIKKYTLDLPPTSFAVDEDWSASKSESSDSSTNSSNLNSTNSKIISAQEYAQHILGSGASVGFDYRDVTYDDKIYGRMPDVAWRTIISRNNELIDITSVIEKNVVRVAPERALLEIERIFSEGRPVAFTFIWSDHEGRAVVGLNSEREYVAKRPPTQSTYTGSHLVLVTGLIRDADGHITGIEVLDPLAKSLNDGFRIVTTDFFFKHGKTVHEIEKSCAKLLL